ncbi:hypothetical protein [Paenibacillus sp. NEAU-GSW1]|uniref:hypothetical protein n=1 Tax=Paenibacillus sp. NEAU-GSW1 TaxID=2682486 RepID=UPI0012E119F9|nr:hypothetical protein [Paenibacillus sp. NEAU-GSW1]MUT64644.1 hypothetical protein [Paenibacillus sp. NEAU-GSW1]
MGTFNYGTFIEKYNRIALEMLLSFLDVEINDDDFNKEIKYFLNDSKIGEKKELGDHFIEKINLQEVLIYNETAEMFAQNPSQYRFVIDIAQLVFLINQKMVLGIEDLRAKLCN